jgi:hypothetical protein
MALIGQISIIVHRAYRDEPGKAGLCKDLEKLLDMSTIAAQIGRQPIKQKEAKYIKKKIEEMVFDHFGTIDSCRVFFSLFVALVGDLIVIFNKKSRQRRALKEILSHIGICINHTEGDPRNEEHDKKALDLLEIYKGLFCIKEKEAAEEMEA